MVRIRRFGVLRTASVLALLYGLAALVFFGIFAVFVLVAGVQSPSMPGGIPGFDAGAGAVGILIFGAIAAALYGIFGWIFTAIFCLLYNWVAGFAGGVEIKLEAVTLPVPAAPVPPPAGPPAPPPAEG
ncbi:MAG TPA: hypothetical protein VFP83_00630 [Candidatus Limnocylindria bacterium]|nr:hypothetical protein [Candidatus Limnocylindria bacterium]